jgi:anti-sigma factor RsiW
MNCADFNDRLYEYLDGTLDSESQAAAREHLRQCGDCRRVLSQEQAAAQSIQRSLERATAGLSLRAATLRAARAARESPVPAQLWLRPWQWFMVSSFRPAGAALACLALLILGMQVYRHAAERSAPQAAAQAAPGSCAIDVPFQATVHLFRTQGDAVVDAIAPSAAVGRARFFVKTDHL